MRTSLIVLSFLAILSTSCFANGMEAPAKAATPRKAATPAPRAETAGKAEATPKADAAMAPKAETQANGKVAATAKTSAPKPAAPALPDDLTPRPIRHVAICPPPKIALCVMRKPVTVGYRVLTNGVDVDDDGANWLVDFGRGPKESRFLLQVLETGSSLHEIEVRFQTKPGMQKTPTLPEYRFVFLPLGSATASGLRLGSVKASSLRLGSAKVSGWSPQLLSPGGQKR